MAFTIDASTARIIAAQTQRLFGQYLCEDEAGARFAIEMGEVPACKVIATILPGSLREVAQASWIKGHVVFAEA